MNPAQWLARTASITPQAPALLHGTEMVATYAQFGARSAAIAGSMQRDFGLAKGERVAIFMKNRTEYLEVSYGIWWAGAAAVPVNAKLHPKEAAWIIENAQASAVFISDDVGEDLLKEIDQSKVKVISVDQSAYTEMLRAEPLADPVPIDAQDMVWLFYTSGTTGRPKGVMMSSQNIQSMMLGYYAGVGTPTHADATLYAAPMSHGAGVYSFMHVVAGGRHVCPVSGGFDAAEILEVAPKIGNIAMFAAPTMVHRLVDEAKKTGGIGKGLDTIIYAGGPMYFADIVDAVDVMGPRFVQIYGQGECPMAITVLNRQLVCDRKHPRWQERLRSVGVAQVASHVRVVGEDMNDLPNGEVGEIVVSGSAVMTGYWDNEEATAAAIVDGWLKTGDMGTLDEDGFLTMRDRSKDMIISGGSNIYPREVEEVLLMHPNLAEVAVVGRFHEEWGEEVVAIIAPEKGKTADLAELDELCIENIARFKRPKHYIVMDQLPKNNYGKILKRDLREMLKNTEKGGPVQ
ncbi:Long-chain-fatty-acid--CoA ligase FadD13 [Pseudovibrio axinellae]|uniref:3-methylmercaptopropionyl-CoA ligase n=1 Tax=Pseudovibrio axinellae TaxID=989403 RepID=A0A165U1K2_9HYPH|nr:AMP-binding protein [Pseudovibrio axinellae]KZL09439.1 Long-chain-fatty-acid--CoA ligase FadD13 [Pseudovibrio axinellae]SEQ64868.1 long-chain acyl-CoA synthetase [Pseudovibrio axinellae]